jgi:hypothetical protein
MRWHNPAEFKRIHKLRRMKNMIEYDGITFSSVDELIEYKQKMQAKPVAQFPSFTAESGHDPVKPTAMHVAETKIAEPKRKRGGRPLGTKTKKVEKRLALVTSILEKAQRRITTKRLIKAVFGKEVSRTTRRKFLQSIPREYHAKIKWTNSEAGGRKIKADAIVVPAKNAEPRIIYRNKRRTRYTQFLKDNIKRIMINEKVDYLTACRLARARYNKLYKLVEQEQAPSYKQFPAVAQNVGMVRQVTKDLLNKHILKISDDYQDSFGVQDWDRFLLKFMLMSKDIAEHFGVQNRFKMIDKAIVYEG